MAAGFSRDTAAAAHFAVGFVVAFVAGAVDFAAAFFAVAFFAGVEAFFAGVAAFFAAGFAVAFFAGVAAFFTAGFAATFFAGVAAFFTAGFAATFFAGAAAFLAGAAAFFAAGFAVAFFAGVAAFFTPGFAAAFFADVAAFFAVVAVAFFAGVAAFFKAGFAVAFFAGVLQPSSRRPAVDLAAGACGAGSCRTEVSAASEATVFPVLSADSGPWPTERPARGIERARRRLLGLAHQSLLAVGFGHGRGGDDRQVLIAAPARVVRRRAGDERQPPLSPGREQPAAHRPASPLRQQAKRPDLERLLESRGRQDDALFRSDREQLDVRTESLGRGVEVRRQERRAERIAEPRTTAPPAGGPDVVGGVESAPSARVDTARIGMRRRPGSRASLRPFRSARPRRARTADAAGSAGSVGSADSRRRLLRRLRIGGDVRRRP